MQIVTQLAASNNGYLRNMDKTYVLFIYGINGNKCSILAPRRCKYPQAVGSMDTIFGVLVYGS
jgi:hypothetical protein